MSKELPSHNHIHEDLSLIGAVSQAEGQALAASSVSAAMSAKSDLASLAARADIPRSVLNLILGAMRSADATIAKIETEQSANSALKIEAERFKVDAATQRLEDSFRERGMLTPEEDEFLRNLDPNAVLRIQKFDKNGNLVAGEFEDITGAELKKATLILKGQANYDKLNTQQRKDFHKLVHGKETAPKTKAELDKAEDSVKWATGVKGGYQYSKAKTPEAKDKVQQDTKSLITDYSGMFSSPGIKQRYYDKDEDRPAATKEDKEFSDKINTFVGNTAAAFNADRKEKSKDTAAVPTKPDDLKLTSAQKIMDGFNAQQKEKESLRTNLDIPAAKPSTPTAPKLTEQIAAPSIITPDLFSLPPIRTGPPVVIRPEKKPEPGFTANSANAEKSKTEPASTPAVKNENRPTVIEVAALITDDDDEKPKPVPMPVTSVTNSPAIPLKPLYTPAPASSASSSKPAESPKPAAESKPIEVTLSGDTKIVSLPGLPVLIKQNQIKQL